MPAEAEGRSLLPVIHGDQTKFVEETFAGTLPCGWQTLKDDPRRIWCVRTPQWKLIYNEFAPREENHYELFDLENDRGEKSNVLEQHPKMAESLKQKLHKWMSKEQLCPAV